MSEPHDVFRWLPRSDRARYVELMHATMDGKLRDLDRAGRRLGGEVGMAVQQDVDRMRGVGCW